MVGIGICRCLLGGHVGRRTECHARGGELLAAGGFADGFGHTEIHHQRMTPRDHDVVGLDVAMDHSLLVRVRQSVYHFAKNLYRFGYWELAFFLDSLAQGFAPDVGHDVVEEPVGFARVVEWQYMRVLELRGDLDFAQETIRTQGCGQLRLQYFDGDIPIVFEVAGQVHRGHTTGAEFFFDLVFVGESGGEAGEDIGHVPRTEERSAFVFFTTAKAAARRSVGKPTLEMTVASATVSWPSRGFTRGNSARRCC